MLINKRGNHAIDKLDRVFKAYDAYKSLALLPQNAASGGLYAYLDASRSQELTNTQIAVDNTINGETIIARIKEDINFSGVKMTAHDVDIEAVNFNFDTSQDRYNYEYDCGNVSIDIDLLSDGLLSNASASTQSVRSNTTIHHENYIKASGNLKLTLSGDGKFKGVSLEGANVDIKANNLILESVQDTISEKLRGANFHIGFDQEYNINGIGGGVEAGYKNSAWTNQVARIIGSQVVNIAVKETLEIAGGLIANAEEDKDGNLTDKGNLSISCGRMIVKTIHDYDEGVTLGIGASFQVKASEKVGKEGTKEVNFDHASLKLELKDKRGEVSSVIGQGSINARNISGDILNRDITTQTTITRNEVGSFDNIIHADMFDRLTGNPPKRPVSVKRADTEAVRSYFDPDPSLVSSTGYYFSDIAENVKDAVKDLVTGGATATNFLGGKIDIKNLNTSMDKIFGGERYMQEFASKIAKSEFEYANIVDQNLLAKLGNKKTDLNNNKELLEDTSELGIVALQKSLEEKISSGVENKSSLQALLHILKDRYVKAGSKGDFNEFVKSTVAEILAKNPGFATKVAKDFEQAVNFARQTIAGYIYKLALEKAQAEWQKEQAKAKQIKKEQARERQARQQEEDNFEESIRGYEQYLRHNYPHTTATVKPNSESLSYINTIIEIQQQQTLEKYDDQIEKILDNNSKLPTNIPIADKALVDAITDQVKQDSSNISSNEQNKIIAQTYYLYKECQAHPEKTPEMRLAFAGAIVIPFGEWLISTLIAAAVAYKLNQDIPVIKEIILGKPAAEKYNKISLEKAKIREKTTSTSLSFDIDPEAGNPRTLSTPIPRSTKSEVISTPIAEPIKDHGGFTPVDPEFVRAGSTVFPPVTPHWSDYILYKKIDLDYDKLSKDHFDKDVQYIHDKKYAGAKITDLDPAVQARMKDLVITDKNGKITGIHNCADHHAVHRNIPGAKKLFEDLGLDIDKSKENRITLPADEELTKRGITDMTQHIGRHDDIAVKPLEVKVKNIQEALRSSNITREQAKEKLLNIIQEEKQNLIDGTKPLNKIGRF
ncbi:MAG: hemagglutinin repeat-containing protein [Rickettsia endosymbiont of Pentastiridius leporinus]